MEKSSPAGAQQDGVSVLRRQLTLDATVLLKECGGALQLSACSSVTHTQALAPGHPASPFSSAASDIMAAFDCMKLSAGPDAHGTAPQAHRTEAIVAATVSSSVCCSLLECTSMASNGPAHMSRVVTQYRSECLSAAFSGLGSQLPLALASQASVSGSTPQGQAPNANVPPHGVKAICGKRNKMEDTYAVQPNFFDIPFSPTADDGYVDKLPVRIAVQLEQTEGSSPASSLPISPSTCQPGSDADPSTACCSCNSSEGGITDTLHFFGVYDGHGGCQAAEHCAKRLHHHLSEALAAVCSCLMPDNNQCSTVDEAECQPEWPASLASARVSDRGQVNVHQGSKGASANASALDSVDYQDLLTKNSVDSLQSEQDEQRGAGSAPAREQQHTHDNDDADSAVDGGSSSGSSDRSVSETAVSLSSMMEDALKEAFVRTDAEFANDGCAQLVGSTALVALVGRKKIWLANCGDSRAVLCRGGKAIQLTDDHKPEREDEAERVEKAGGQVLFWNGHRVMGVLAMSRAIGDHGLRPYIIPEPEVSVLTRQEDDEFLLLASDGLWDVMANQEATNLTQRCFKRARDKGASRSAAVRIAAAVLTKAAIDRGSKDNVTVVIVDVKPTPAGEAPASATACSSGSSCNSASTLPSKPSTVKAAGSAGTAAGEVGEQLASATPSEVACAVHHTRQQLARKQHPSPLGSNPSLSTRAGKGAVADAVVPCPPASATCTTSSEVGPVAAVASAAPSEPVRMYKQPVPSMFQTKWAPCQSAAIPASSVHAASAFVMGSAQAALNEPEAGAAQPKVPVQLAAAKACIKGDETASA